MLEERKDVSERETFQKKFDKEEEAMCADGRYDEKGLLKRSDRAGRRDRNEIWRRGIYLPR